MARQRDPNREKAFKIYKQHNGKIELVEIAKILNLPPGTIRGWKSKDKWNDKLNGTLQKNTERSKRGPGAPKGNHNAKGNKGGHGGPVGNTKAVKHGAYSTVYTKFLSDEEKEIYEQLDAKLNLENEIKIIKLKIARLLNREQTFVYDMYGKKHTKEISEENREQGILILMDQLRKLIETQAKINNDSSKFEFDKYKTEIDLQLKREKLELDKRKNDDTEEEYEDDGFIEALQSSVEDVWKDEE